MDSMLATPGGGTMDGRSSIATETTNVSSSIQTAVSRTLRSGTMQTIPFLNVGPSTGALIETFVVSILRHSSRWLFKCSYRLVITHIPILLHPEEYIIRRPVLENISDVMMGSLRMNPDHYAFDSSLLVGQGALNIMR
jgi:hypothetical protein